MKKKIEEIIEPKENRLKLVLTNGTSQREFSFSSLDPDFGQALLQVLNITPEIVDRISPPEELAFPSRVVSLDTIVTDDDFSLICDATAAPFTVTIPFASTGGRLIVVVKADSSGNAVTIETSGLDEFSGGSDISLSSQWAKALLLSDGSNTWIQVI
jgi:hypothetical protein